METRETFITLQKVNPIFMGNSTSLPNYLNYSGTAKDCMVKENTAAYGTIADLMNNNLVVESEIIEFEIPNFHCEILEME